MSATAERVHRGSDRTIVTIRHGNLTYYLRLVPVHDFNNQHIGYHAWFQKHNELFANEESAIFAALQLVNQINAQTSVELVMNWDDPLPDDVSQEAKPRQPARRKRATGRATGPSRDSATG